MAIYDVARSGRSGSSGSGYVAEEKSAWMKQPRSRVSPAGPNQKGRK